MIKVEIKPRQDNLFDIYVGDEGDEFLNSSQGYENVEDAIAIARRLWPPIALPTTLGGPIYAPEVERGRTNQTVVTGVVDVPMEHAKATVELLTMMTERVVMRVTYRNGKTMTEQLR